MKVTNKSLHDGFGSQYQHIISTLLICYKNNYEFIYTPIRKMEHNYNGENDFIERVEKAMNLKPHFSLVNEDTTEEQLREQGIRVYDMDAKYVIDNHIHEYATPEALQPIKTMFWANKNREKALIFQNEDTSVKHVAVHIRRPNAHDNRLLGSDTPDDYYLGVIQRIRETYDFPMQFHIYSQGDLSMFSRYIAPDTVFHLNEDLISTFVAFVAADILVTSFSSYSYIAAFLSDGIIYYHPFWHPPMKHWMVCER